MRTRIERTITTSIDSKLFKAKEPVIFEVSEMCLDHLHFIRPCSESIMKRIQKDGLTEATKYLENMHQRAKLRDNSELYFLGRIQVHCYLDLAVYRCIHRYFSFSRINNG